MKTFPHSVVPDTAQLRRFEKSWIANCHSQWGLVLMEQAGSNAAAVVLSLWRQTAGTVVVLCGGGNNGGDGFVTARYLHIRHVPVVVYYVENIKSSDARKGGEAAINLSVAAKSGVAVYKIDADNLEAVHSALNTCTIVVDALLGTGLDRPVAGLYQQLIDMVNKNRRPVVAVDLPSGINSDTGQIMGCAIRAAATVTFGCLKPGLLAFPAVEFCGHLWVADLGMPPVDKADTMLSTREFARSHMVARYADSHKGSCGAVLTIAGSCLMPGAAALSSVAALRAGAGLSTLAATQAVAAKVRHSEVMYRLLPETKDGSIGKQAHKLIADAMMNADSVAVGPGLSLNEETAQLVCTLLSGIEKPCVVDGDALTAVAHNPGCIGSGKARDLVLTPHPGELSRLLGIDTATIQNDRYNAVRSAAKQFACVVLLKGSRTLIAGPDGTVFVNSTGNPAMSTAGSGDVLTGVIAAYMAQGLSSFDAAILGAYVHGAAGDIAAAGIADAGILAGDISNCVPVAKKKICSGEYPGSALEVQLSTVPFAPRH